jgi:hypothetical protein
MADAKTTKRLSAAREKQIGAARRGKALKRPPNPPPVEGQELQFRPVTCPEGHVVYIEYDPDHYSFYQCPVCHCNFEL